MLAAHAMLISQPNGFSADTSDPTIKSHSNTNIPSSLGQASAQIPISDSPTKELMKKYTKISSEYSSLNTESYINAQSSAHDQALRERLKNIGTLAPKANDATPTNPFSQVSTKNISSFGAALQSSQDASYSSTYQTLNYNIDIKSVPKYGNSYPQDAKYSTNTPQTSSRQSLKEDSKPPSSVPYSYKNSQNLIPSNHSSRYSTNQTPASGDDSFNNGTSY